MRVMMMVRANEQSEAGVMPTEEELAAMGRFNEKMVEAGVMLAGEGLDRSASGARVSFSGGKPTVIDGPFTEVKELIAGYWLMQVRSMEEAIEWARRVPFQDGEIELRRVFEADDFGEALTPELQQQEERLRAKTKEQQGQA